MISITVLKKYLSMMYYLTIADSDYSDKFKAKFKSVRMLSDSVTCLEDDVLYVCRASQIRHYAQNNNSGFIVMGDEFESTCDRLVFPEETDLLQILNRVLGVFDHLSSWRSRLSKAALKPRAMDTILTIASEEIHFPMYAVDSGYRVLGITPFYEGMAGLGDMWLYLSKKGYIPFDTIINLERSKELQQNQFMNQSSMIESKLFKGPFVNYAMYDKNEFLGHFFVVEYLRKVDEVDIELSNTVAETVKEAVLSKGDKFTGTYSDNFLRDMLSGAPMDADAKRRQLVSLNWSDEMHYVIGYFEASAESQATLKTIAHSLKNEVGCKSLVEHDSLTIVAAEKDHVNIDKLINNIGRFVKNAEILLGMSDTFFSIDRFSVYYGQAKTAFNLANHDKTGLYYYEDYLMADLVNTLSESKNITAYSEPSLLFLKKYDHAHSAPYCQTLRTFLQNERHLGKTAIALGIHRNTLLYRLEKIKDLTPLDLDDYEMRRRCLLTFDLLDYQSFS